MSFNLWKSSPNFVVCNVCDYTRVAHFVRPYGKPEPETFIRLFDYNRTIDKSVCRLLKIIAQITRRNGSLDANISRVRGGREPLSLYFNFFYEIFTRQRSFIVKPSLDRIVSIQKKTRVYGFPRFSKNVFFISLARAYVIRVIMRIRCNGISQTLYIKRLKTLMKIKCSAIDGSLKK